MKILLVTSSARGEKSLSTLLAKEIFNKISFKYPNYNLIERNLVNLNIPHLDDTFLQSYQSTDEYIGIKNPNAIKFINKSIDEVKAADIIIIAFPYYNFSIPSCLKAWLDHIIRAHKTFQYKNGQSIGLLQNKKVYLSISSGGVYTSNEEKHKDFAEPYLRFILDFIGITDVTTFRIEGTALSKYKNTAIEKGISSVII